MSPNGASNRAAGAIGRAGHSTGELPAAQLEFAFAEPFIFDVQKIMHELAIEDAKSPGTRRRRGCCRRGFMMARLMRIKIPFSRAISLVQM